MKASNLVIYIRWIDRGIYASAMSIEIPYVRLYELWNGKLRDNDQEMPPSHTVYQFTALPTWHQEDNQSKATSTSFLNKIIA